MTAVTTGRQPLRMTREEWLALPLEDQSGAPLDDARTKRRDFACYAHYRLNGTKAQLTSVEVDGDVEKVVVRLAFANDALDAPSAIACLKERWPREGARAPIAKHLSFEVMRPN